MADPTSPTTDPTSPTDSGSPAPDVVDMGRRRFFRQFAGELANTAATMVGAAQAIQKTSAELAGAILDPTILGPDPTAVASPSAAAVAEAATGSIFRTAFRLDGPTIYFVDQRALPRAVVEHAAISAAEVSWAIRNDVVLGGPAMGQAAAFGLALTAERVRNTRPYARRATLRGAANALINASPGHASLASAVGRAMAAYTAAGELEEDGGPMIDAMRAEAERIVAEATDDHGRLVAVGLAAVEELPRNGEEPLRLLVHGQSGTLAGGQFGTALAIAIAAHHAEHPVWVIVPEARPGFDGSRVTCWELASAGVPHLLVADSAAASLIASGDVDAVLVPADRVAVNGDLGATIGTYPLAVVAARHGIPVIACVPTSAVDPAATQGRAIQVGSRQAGALDRFADVALAPRGTEVRVPTHDVTPAALITSYVTADGLRVPPFGEPA